MNKIVKILLWSVGIILFVAAVTVVVYKYGNNTCKEIRINIHAPENAVFIDEQEVRDYIMSTSGNLVGAPVKKINVELIEKIINNNPYVLSSKVYLHLNGVMQIDIDQRTPVARVQNTYNQSFYICSEGHLIPLSPGKTARVPFANGNIPNVYFSSLVLTKDTANHKKTDTVIHTQALQQIYNVASYIATDEFLKAQIQQIFIDEKGNILLTPLVGDGLILLGDEQNLDDKFTKLKVFLTRPEFLENWTNYDTINIGFQNQIICSKKYQTK
jgi:cell division protein FtsQ